jgi:hypothetical protein
MCSGHISAGQELLDRGFIAEVRALHPRIEATNIAVHART